MARSLLDDAFAHQTWATLQLVDACIDATLAPEQLEADVPGTPGSILRTLQHLVGSHGWFLSLLVPERAPAPDTRTMGLAALRSAVERTADGWRQYLGSNPDPEATVRDVDGHGWQRDAPVGLRLAQALHHGDEHRSQVCGALTALGIQPPDISAWAFGVASGRSTEVMP